MNRDYICLSTAEFDTLLVLLAILFVSSTVGWIYIGLTWLGVL